MKRLLAPLALTLLLAACGSQTVRFTVSYNTPDPLRRSELSAAIQRSIVGRMEAKKKKVVSQQLKNEDGKTVLTVSVSDAEAATLLKESLTGPFSMTIMKQVDAGKGDIISEKYGEFKETGMVTKHFDWVTAGTSMASGRELGSVGLQFTDEGQSLLKDMFSHNRGSIIGVFVRGMLMSKKQIDATDKQTSIVIDGIPSGALAAAFADDVNVGLHVTFAVAP